MTLIPTPPFQALCDLVLLIRNFNLLGHNPATSGNYSLRDREGVIWISESGIDKGQISTSNFLPIDESGTILNASSYSGRKTSDETDLHTAIYRETDAGCVLHTHGLAALIWCERRLKNKEPLQFSGLEMLKALRGIRDHQMTVAIPMVENSQDMAQLASKAKTMIKVENTWCLILRGHGIYVWGKDQKEAKRHWEALNHMFEFENGI